MWYQSLQNGELHKAQLRDGLHGPVGLRLVQAVHERLPGLLGKIPLLDLLSYRHGHRSPGLPWHCVDGLLVAMVLFGDVADSTVDFLAPSSSATYCKSRRAGPAPALSLEEFLREATSSPSKDSSAACGRGCLLLWRASRSMRTVHKAERKDFEARPLELLMSFGNNFVHDAGASTTRFAPTFEGKTDSWGGHYYARDHDHR